MLAPRRALSDRLSSSLVGPQPHIRKGELERMWNGEAGKGGKCTDCLPVKSGPKGLFLQIHGHSREATALLPKPGVVGSSPIVRFNETPAKRHLLSSYLKPHRGAWQMHGNRIGRSVRLFAKQLAGAAPVRKRSVHASRGHPSRSDRAIRARRRDRRLVHTAGSRRVTMRRGRHQRRSRHRASGAASRSGG
jgi:hypothetical protein